MWSLRKDRKSLIKKWENHENSLKREKQILTLSVWRNVTHWTLAERDKERGGYFVTVIRTRLSPADGTTSWWAWAQRRLLPRVFCACESLWPIWRTFSSNVRYVPVESVTCPSHATWPGDPTPKTVKPQGKRSATYAGLKSSAGGELQPRDSYQSELKCHSRQTLQSTGAHRRRSRPDPTARTEPIATTCALNSSHETLSMKHLKNAERFNNDL